MNAEVGDPDTIDIEDAVRRNSSLPRRVRVPVVSER